MTDICVHPATMRCLQTVRTLALAATLRLHRVVPVAVFMWMASMHGQAQIKDQGQMAELFGHACATCHGNPAVHAPPPQKLQQLSPETIYNALTTGTMRVQAQALSDETKRALTAHLAGRPPDLERIADAAHMPNRCTTDARIDLDAPGWNGWSHDPGNTRIQDARNAGLAASQVPHLQLRWAFGFPGASVVYAQPTVAGGVLFIGADTGYVYSLDARNGCVHWSYRARAGVRSSVIVGERGKGGHSRQPIVYFGDLRGNVYALDAVSGRLLWESVAESHPAARITGSPRLYGTRLYVPVSSLEEGVAGDPHYPCCTFRGSVVAFDRMSGRRLWQAYMIDEPARPLRKNSVGTQMWGPSGGSIWGSITLDPTRHALYVATGNAYNLPALAGTDSAVGLDMDSGRLLWRVQDRADDAWIVGCWPPKPAPNCPAPLGPDSDFGAPPILQTLFTGHRLLIAGQKSGDVWAHDPDTQGELRWHVTVASQARPEGEFVWGGAADGTQVYFGLGTGGIVALNVSDGQRAWFNALTPDASRSNHKGESGPLSGIAGVLFSGGWDAVVRALDTSDGHVVWSFDTARPFTTVNGVQAKGGSIGAAGPIVAGGMLYVPSGYVGTEDGMPGNVLLAFAP